MALNKNLTLENGILLSGAYIKVSKIEIELVKPERTIVTVCIYKDVDAYTDKKAEVLSIKHICSGNDYKTYFSTSVLSTVDTNFLSQSYLWLKNKVYVNAQDV